MKYRVTKSDKILKGTIELEGSKSITNRVFIVKALCPDFFEINNFSVSDDSVTLLEQMGAEDRLMRCKDGGTTLRFLTALMAIHEGEAILTGSESLTKRPIAPLVDALRTLGADIEYLGLQGYPPLLVKGKKLTGNRVELDAQVSSQFISALLLIAPLLQDGLVLRLKGDIVSRPYIEMTLSVMKHFGIHCDWTQSVISVPHQEYVARRYNVEGDWTAASYYYAMAALSEEVDLKLMGLNRLSYQGDAKIAEVMRNFGVQTDFIEGGVRLTKTPSETKSLDLDFKEVPDLAQTVLACAAGAGVAVKARGLETLPIKETDRIEAMKTELEKLNLNLIPLGATWNLGVAKEEPAGTLEFNTYHDHRMAMCLTPLAVKYGEVIIDNPLVVTKSYTGFWDDIQKLGFQVEEID